MGDRDGSKLERVSTLAKAFLFSRAYTVFVGVHVVLNLILFIWEMATVAGFKLPEHGLFVFLEICPSSVPSSCFDRSLFDFILIGFSPWSFRDGSGQASVELEG